MITLDFSKKRVRYNGKALSKSDIADIFEIVCDSCSWLIIYSSLSYDLFAKMFFDYVLNDREKCENRLGDCLSIEI